ncbi:MAG: hypothetical protein QM677_07335 [Microbacterium sp.]
MHKVDIRTLRRLLLTRDEVISAGRTVAQVRSDLAERRLMRVRRGWCIAEAEWASLWPESRHLAHVVAVNDSAQTRPVFALTSAAAIQGLALYRVRVERVHTVHPDAARRSNGDIVRHRGHVDDADIVDVDGILCTSVERTVYDLARLTSAEVALVGIDTALGRIGGDPRRYDERAASEWLTGMGERIAAGGAARGIRHARTLISIADGRSQQPLEITTKLQLRRLGFAQPSLQVPVPDPRGGRYWMDIGLDDVNAFYECDGETKYTDEAMRSGRPLEEVLLAEKQREDWVRGTTGRRVLRGGSRHSASPDALAARLQSFGVAIPDRRERLLIPRRPLTYGQ